MSGSVSFTRHALEEMLNEKIERVDVLNVMRAGRILEEGEEVLGTWRYRVHTSEFVVVVAFEELVSTIRVVTAWRKKRGR